MRRACALAVLVLGIHGAFWDGGTAAAQSWPANPIRFIVPFPPGGTTDQIARRVQPLLQADLKTTIVIENRAGAGGAIGTSPMVITSHPMSEYRSFADVIAAARKKDGLINYGTVGAGSLAHLAMSQIANETKVMMTHVPYKGGGPLATDAIAGHVPVAIASIALLSPHISAGALRPLAVTSADRYPQLPDIPTVREQGIAIDAQSWWGLL